MACRPPGVKTFSSRMRSPTMSTETNVSPSASSLGRRMSRDARLHRAELAPAAHRGAALAGLRASCTRSAAAIGPVAGRAAPVDGHPVADPERLGVEQQEALLPLIGLGEVLLRQRVALLGHRGDHLVEVRDLTPPQVEDVLPAARRQRLQHRRPVERLQEGLEARLRARHQRARPNVGGKVGQVHPAAGAAHPLRIVDHQRARQPQPPAEVDERRARAPLAFAGRVVAQEDHVEAAQRVLFDHRLVGGERVGVGGRIGDSRRRGRGWSSPGCCCRRGS